MKKISVLTLIFMFAFSISCFAAVSGSKARTSSPSVPSSTQKATTAPAAAPTTPANEYKPSAPASSYSDKAPAAKAAASQTSPAQQSSSGGFMRNLGMIGGGMLLGGMLGSMFGGGAGSMLSNLIGIAVNLLMVVGIFMAGRYLWNKIRSSSSSR
jgi:hypothetical protein